MGLEELDAVLQKLQSMKSQGLDGIHPTFLEAAAPSIKNTIVMAFNNILETQILPEKWENDCRIPIHKKGSKAKCGKYRLLAKHSVSRQLFTGSTMIERSF